MAPTKFLSLDLRSEALENNTRRGRRSGGCRYAGRRSGGGDRHLSVEAWEEDGPDEISLDRPAGDRRDLAANDAEIGKFPVGQAPELGHRLTVAPPIAVV